MRIDNEIQLKSRPKEVTVEESIGIFMIDPNKRKALGPQPINARNLAALPMPAYK